jgi:hypothetical protein
MNQDVLFGALLAGGFSILTLIANELFNLLRDKRMMKERFFQDIFPMRLKLYEEVVRTVTKLGDYEALSKSSSGYALVGVIEKELDSLVDLEPRCVTVASIEVTKGLGSLARVMADISEAGFTLPHDPDPGSKEVFIQIYSAILQPRKDKLIECIRKESGQYIVDQKLAKLTKYTVRKKNPRK